MVQGVAAGMVLIDGGESDFELAFFLRIDDIGFEEFRRWGG